MEVSIDPTYVCKLYSAMDTDKEILVVGPALQGHEFNPSAGRQECTGRSCPWNTFAGNNLMNCGFVYYYYCFYMFLL